MPRKELENVAGADESPTFEKTKHTLLKSHGAGQVCVQKENESHKKETEFACLRKELCHGLCYVLRGWEMSQGAKASWKTCPVALGMWFFRVRSCYAYVAGQSILCD